MSQWSVCQFKPNKGHKPGHYKPLNVCLVTNEQNKWHWDVVIIIKSVHSGHILTWVPKTLRSHMRSTVKCHWRPSRRDEHFGILLISMFVLCFRKYLELSGKQILVCAYPVVLSSFKVKRLFVATKPEELMFSWVILSFMCNAHFPYFL